MVVHDHSCQSNFINIINVITIMITISAEQCGSFSGNVSGRWTAKLVLGEQQVTSDLFQFPRGLRPIMFPRFSSCASTAAFIPLGIMVLSAEPNLNCMRHGATA